MLNKQQKLIVTYFTSSEAIATEKLCNEKGIPGGRIITTPRDITADCGMSFSIGIDQKEALMELLKSERIKYDKIIVKDV